MWGGVGSNELSFLHLPDYRRPSAIPLCLRRTDSELRKKEQFRKDITKANLRYFAARLTQIHDFSRVGH